MITGLSHPPQGERGCCIHHHDESRAVCSYARLYCTDNTSRPRITHPACFFCSDSFYECVQHKRVRQRFKQNGVGGFECILNGIHYLSSVNLENELTETHIHSLCHIFDPHAFFISFNTLFVKCYLGLLSVFSSFSLKTPWISLRISPINHILQDLLRSWILPFLITPHKSSKHFLAYYLSLGAK